MSSLSTLVLIDHEGHEHVLFDEPIHVGSDPTCAVRLSAAAPVVARLSRAEVEAVEECLVGSVPLGAGRRRRLVGRTTLGVGDVEMRIEERWEVREVSTRQLAFEIVKLAPHPEVVIVEGPGSMSAMSLVEEREYIVGRTRKSDLVLEDEATSREHVALLRRGEVVLVRDLGSRQGTHLGATRLAASRKAVWSAEHMLRVGKTVLALRLPDRKEKVLASAARAEDAVEAEMPIEEARSVREDTAPPRSSDLALPTAPAPIAAPGVTLPRPASRRPPHEVAVLALGAVIIVTGIAAIIWLIAIV